MPGIQGPDERPGRATSLFGRREREALRRRQAETDRLLEQAHREGAVPEQILDAIDQGAILLDERGTPVRSNRAARAMLGIVAGRQSPALESIRLAALAEAVRASGRPSSSEHELHVPVRRRLSIQIVPFDAGTLALIDDITTVRRSEQVRRDFVANVSHELKTPITGIALLAEQLTDAIRENPGAAERFAERIHLESERLTRLVVDLLDLSRMESDLPLAVGDVAAATIVEDAVARVSAYAEAKGISITIIGADAAPLVAADLGAAATAIANLLDNAVRHSTAGSSVTITVAAPHDDAVSFAVEDRGSGIPTEELGRIFERFYRVDKARARATGGTGLGLAIVKHVAERHGGRVDAESEFGRGSRFTLVLPRGGRP